MKKQLLDEDIKKRVFGVLLRTWETIASDIFQLLEEEGKYSMPRSHVIEVVLDADYAEMHGGDKECLKEFRELDYKDQIKIAKECFTYSRYS